MDPASSIPQVPKPIPVPEYRDNPFEHPLNDQSQHKKREELTDEEKRKKEQEHHGGNVPGLGDHIDIDG